MAIPSMTLTGPRGRLVQGDAFKANTTDQNGQPLTIKTGANAGQPRHEWFIAVAYSKADPLTAPYLDQLVKYAAQAWPHFFPAGASVSMPNFGSTHPRFSFKIADGDGVDDNGKQNRDKPGWAGHWIVKYASGFAPGVWQEPNFDEMARVADPRMLPRGYFVRVNHSISSNENDQRPGVYVNLQKIAISADQAGAEIIQSGQSAADAFGGGSSTPAPAPAAAAAAGGLIPTPGATHTPEALRAAGWTDDQIVAGGYATRAPVATPAPLPVPPPAVPPAATPPAPSAPAPAPTPSPSSPAPAPYAGYMQPPAPAATGRVMLPAAGGATYETMIAAGWTDEMLVAHGMMAA